MRRAASLRHRTSCHVGGAVRLVDTEDVICRIRIAGVKLNATSAAYCRVLSTGMIPDPLPVYS